MFSAPSKSVTPQQQLMIKMIRTDSVAHDDVIQLTAHDVPPVDHVDLLHWSNGLARLHQQNTKVGKVHLLGALFRRRCAGLKDTFHLRASGQESQRERDDYSCHNASHAFGGLA
jgi:hypothetical protein